MEKKHLIVFDIDGTLANSVALHQAAFTAALYKMGVESIDSNFKAYKHHTDSYIAKVIYENDRKEIFSASKIEVFESLLTDLILKSKIDEIAGAKKLVEYLENQTDYAVCYATGSLRKPAIYKLNSIGVSYNEKQLVAANHLHERETIVQTAINQAQQFYQVEKFERIISFGDGLWDLMTANNLNIEFVGIGSSNKKLLEKHGVKHHYLDFKEMKDCQDFSFLTNLS